MAGCEQKCCMRSTDPVLPCLLLQPDKIKVPVQVHIGSEDGFFPPDVRTLCNLDVLDDADASESLQRAHRAPVACMMSGHLIQAFPTNMRLASC